MAASDWVKGQRVVERAGSAIGTSRTGTVIWVGRSKRGRLRIGVRVDQIRGAHDGRPVFFTPGDYNEWVPA